MEGNKLDLSGDGRSVFLFCSGIDDVLGGSPNVAGIQVQMSFWARTFAANGWEVVCLSEHQPTVMSGKLRFIKRSTSRWCRFLHLQILLELKDCLKCIRQKPTMVVTRGASRHLCFLVLLCRIKRVTLIHFGASDSDFVPGKELLAGSRANRALYEKSIRRIEHIVTQNSEQKEALKRHYGKDGLTISNIWISDAVESSKKRYDAIWIANLRPLKRAEWFVRLAKVLPDCRFAMVGGASKHDYYDRIETEAKALGNLDFLGAQPIEEVNKLLSESRLLVCTSEFEGFPNTFLQAWAYGVPVVSTVDPSGVVSEYGLGNVVQDESELLRAFQLFMASDAMYSQCQKNIKDYFTSHHDADMAYRSIMEHLYGQSVE